MDIMIQVLAVVGFCTLFVAVSFVGNFALDELDDFICRKKREYQYKHRFDKSPTAKCYCIDCETYRDGYCHLHRFRIADNWFCRNAMPRDREVKKDD